MSCKRALNFDEWKTFSKNYKPIRGWLWLAYKFTENNCCWELFSEFIQTHLPWQNKYSNLKTTCHIKSKCFLWTKLPKNLLLAKYLISVVATLISAGCKQKVLIVLPCITSQWKCVHGGKEYWKQLIFAFAKH